MCRFANYYCCLIVKQTHIRQTRTRRNLDGLRRLCSSWAIAFIVSILFYIPAASAARVGFDGPEVAIEKTTKDFGDVFAGEELEQNFPVRNLGTKPLELAQKSNLATARALQEHSVARAVWNTSGESLVRRVAASRAAPS